MLSGQGTCTLVPSFCFLRTVPVPDGWQLVDITITVLRSIQALADTLLAWTVCESPLCFRNNYYYAIHTHTHTHTHVYTYAHTHLCIASFPGPHSQLSCLQHWNVGSVGLGTRLLMYTYYAHAHIHAHTHTCIYIHAHTQLSQTCSLVSLSSKKVESLGDPCVQSHRRRCYRLQDHA